MSQTLYSDMELAACEQLARASSQSDTADGASASSPLFRLLFFPSTLDIKCFLNLTEKEKKKNPFAGELLDYLQCDWKQVAAPGILRSRRLITGNIRRSREEFSNELGCVNGEDWLLQCGGREVGSE